nr:toxin Bro [Sedimentibacter sp.]
MDNNLQIFNNNELGIKVRTILNDDGSISINAEDAAIGYGWIQEQNKNGKKYTSLRWETLNDYCKEFGFPNKVGKDDYIPEALFYRLGMKASNAKADRFQNWIAMDVLPSIRKTGSYKIPKPKAEPKQTLSATNTAVKIITKTLESAGVSPQYIAVAVKNAYKPVGIDVPLNGITMESKFYDATTIAEKIGIMSNSNKPHAQAVTAIISDINIDDDEKQLVPFEKNGHSGTTYQYAESVIDKVNEWIKERNYPIIINTKGKKYNVSYADKQFKVS